MQDLRLVGMSEDGLSIIAIAPDNSRFRLPIDESLRVIVRRSGLPRLGATALPDSGADLRPKDIQARIRAGETAEEVSRLSGGWAGPMSLASPSAGWPAKPS